MSHNSCIGSTLLIVAGLAASSASAQELAGQIPAQFRGVWAADCNAPQMRFDEASLEILTGPRMTGTVIKSVVAGDTLEIHYTAGTPPGTAIDVLRIEGDKLRLVETRIVGMGTATWNKQPWQRCGGATAQAQPAGKTAVAAAAPLKLASLRFPGGQPTEMPSDWLTGSVAMRALSMMGEAGGTACQASRGWKWSADQVKAQNVTDIVLGVAGSLQAIGANVRRVEGGGKEFVYIRGEATERAGGAEAVMAAFWLSLKGELFLLACETERRPA